MCRSCEKKKKGAERREGTEKRNRRHRAPRHDQSLSRLFHVSPLFLPPRSFPPSQSIRFLFLSSSFCLGILFACGLVTVGRGEPRARGESTLRGYSNFERVCPECEIPAVAAGLSASSSVPQKGNVAQLSLLARYTIPS